MAFLIKLKTYSSIYKGGVLLLPLLFLINLSFAGQSTLNDVIQSHFPKCKIEKKMIYLSKEELEKASSLSELKIDTGIVMSFLVQCEKEMIHAYIDSQIVRTHTQSMLIAVKNQSIERIRTLNFQEPVEYKAPKKWLDLFKSKILNRELHLKKSIDVVSGATLTSKSTVISARRILAIDKVAYKK